MKDNFLVFWAVCAKLFVEKGFKCSGKNYGFCEMIMCFTQCSYYSWVSNKTFNKYLTKYLVFTSYGILRLLFSWFKFPHYGNRFESINLIKKIFNELYWDVTKTALSHILMSGKYGGKRLMQTRRLFRRRWN